MKQQPATVGRQNSKFLILNAVISSEDEEDSFSSDHSDGEAAMSETPDDVIFSNSAAGKQAAVVAPLFVTTQRSAECKSAVHRPIHLNHY